MSERDPEMPPLSVTDEPMIVTRRVRCDPHLAFEGEMVVATHFGLTSLGIVGALCDDHTQELGFVVSRFIVNAGDPEAIPTPPELMFD